MKDSLPFEASYSVDFILMFVLIFLLSLSAKPISLNLISFISKFFSLTLSSISFLISKLLIPATRNFGGMALMILIILQYLGVCFNISIMISAVFSLVYGSYSFVLSEIS